MGMYVYTEAWQKAQAEDPRALRASELHRLFDESPTGKQEDDREEDWALFHEASRLEAAVNMAFGHFKWSGLLCQVYPTRESCFKMSAADTDALIEAVKKNLLWNRPCLREQYRNAEGQLLMDPYRRLLWQYRILRRIQRQGGGFCVC